jgi:poly(3-hydroxybutyrate) depolymerase
MMKSSGSFLFAITLATVAMVVALDPASGKQRQKKKTVPPLGAYGIDIQQTSVSGVSSGGAMAVQMHVSHSSLMRGVGVIAGVTYDCANSSLSTSALRLSQGLLCLPGNVDYAQASINRTAAAAGVPGAIDDPAANLPRQKVWLFSGYNDGSVRRGAMNAVNTYYRNYATSGNVFYQTDNRAPHALVTNDYGGPCLGFNTNYVNNCGYDAAGHLLQHIYGRLNAPGSSAAGGSVLAFDQGEFLAGGNPKSVGLADRGYVYVPNSCQQTTPCRVHVVFHGCKQYAGKVGDAVYRHGGYNKWASTNQIIVLYPQTTASTENPEGCFDWWGFKQPFATSDFARKTGHQISVFKKMLDRLAQGSVAGPGSPDAFETPKYLSVADRTSSSLALIWQSNTADAGFNIYRSAAGVGSYSKINSAPVTGASFVDGGLSPNTTYSYQIAAVDSASQESPRTTPIPGTTASPPVACDPYFSDNFKHVLALRARKNLLTGKIEAMGSDDDMGQSMSAYRHLIQEGPAFYRLRYCP